MKNTTHSLAALAAAIIFLLAPACANAQSPLLNFDFENWTTDNQLQPFGWLNNNTYGPDSVIRVSQIPGVTGDGIHLHTEGAYPVEGNYLQYHRLYLCRHRGVPYSGSGIPANFNGYYRYHIVSGDSARMVVVLKKSGVMLSIDSFIITGDQPAFTSFSLPLTTVSVVPDSMIFLAESGTFRVAGATPGSFLDMDELHFTNGGSSYPLLNGNFDTWSTVTVTTPDDWTPFGNVSRSTDSHSGSFAAKLVTGDNGSGVEAGKLLGTTINLSAAPYVDTLSGYYKYSTPGADKGDINIVLWDHVVTGASFTKDFLLTPAATYTYFEVPLNNPINASDFNFFISSSYMSLVSGSTLLIDGLKLKSGNTLGVPALKNEPGSLSFYPAPCKDVVHVSVTGTGSINNAPFVLYNMLGQEIESGAISDNCIYLKNVPNGIYLCLMHAGDQVSYGRIEVLN